MADQHEPVSSAHEHAGPDFRAYMTVFYVLCGLTLASFVFNYLAHNEIITVATSVALIVAVAVVKAAFVILIFMHVRWDWGKLYCIIIPVAILAVMMVIVLLPDIVIGWR